MADYSEHDFSALEKILLETSKIPWKELQRFFAAGKAVYIAPDLDLVNVATQFTNDNSTQVQQWMGNAKITMVSDIQAKQWHATNASVWAVVIKPWVLIQEISAQQTSSST